MPKYIDKEQLPQFKHYNFCEGLEYGWDFGNGQDSEAYCKAKGVTEDFGPVLNTLEYADGELDFEEAGDDFRTLLDLKDDDAIFDKTFDKWATNIEKKKSNEWRLVQFVIMLLRAIHPDANDIVLWEQRLKDKTSNMSKSKIDFLEFLAMLDGYLSFALSLRAAQGFPLRYRDGDVIYPKMLLIEDKLYNARKYEKNHLDYELIRNSLRDACYIITINGESAEKKMIFLLCNAGAVTQIVMLDKRNGMSRFFLSDVEPKVPNARPLFPNGKKKGAVISADFWNCHPRGEYDCHGMKGEEICLYCNGVHNCIHKSLPIISAVLYCFQEYQRKLMTEQKVTPDRKTNTKKPGEPVEPFIPKDMIRLYDIKMSEDEFRRADKFALYGKGRESAYPSTEKSPHVRKGTMRYNPKTGQKDIRVRGSIVHKDKYLGFASAERIKA